MTVYPSEAPRQGLVHQYPVVVFFLIAYAFSWTIGGLLIADYQGALSVPGALHYVSAFGPMVAAIVVTALISGRPGLLDLWRRGIRADVGWRWWLIGVGTPVALGVAAIVVFWLSNGVLPDLALFGEVDYLGAIGALAALALWIATYGFGEEVGWRGFAFHRMESGGWMQAAVMIGVLWGLWHLPYFFYKANFIALGIGGFAGYLISITMGSILLSWMYRGSGRSILVVALWHGLFDFVSASPIAEGVGNALISSVVIVWVIVILWLARQDRAGA
ncbi:CPBP family intramembrane glutamic endopeptidase [Roseiflexus sp.]|jgi:membrane protease YdiL (CAAX protease family)